MYKKSGTALGAFALGIYNDILGVIAFGEVGTGNKLAVSSLLIDKLASALWAHLTCLFRFKCYLVNRFLGSLYLGVEFRIENIKDMFPLLLAFFDFIELCLHIRSK